MAEVQVPVVWNEMFNNNVHLCLFLKWWLHCRSHNHIAFHASIQYIPPNANTECKCPLSPSTSPSLSLMSFAPVVLFAQLAADAWTLSHFELDNCRLVSCVIWKASSFLLHLETHIRLIPPRLMELSCVNSACPNKHLRTHPQRSRKKINIYIYWRAQISFLFLIDYHYSWVKRHLCWIAIDFR